MQELFERVLRSSEVFEVDSGRSFIDLNKLANAYGQALIKQKSWINISDYSRPFEKMAKIIACSITNKNIILDPEVADSIGLVDGKNTDTINLNKVHFHDISVGIKTSGSSGFPKTVVLRLSSLLNNAELVSNELGFKRRNTWNLSLPTYHVAGLSILLRCFVKNGCFKIIDKLRMMKDPLDGFISIVSAQIPNIIENKASSPEKLTIFIGGGKINQELTQKLLDRGHPIYSSYGMTETASTFAVKK